jgi:hypothetical protein
MFTGLAQIIRGIYRPIMQPADGDYQFSVKPRGCWPVGLKSGPETELPRLADNSCRIGRALLTTEAGDRSIRSLLVLWSTSTASMYNTAHSCSSWQRESLRRQDGGSGLVLTLAVSTMSTTGAAIQHPRCATAVPGLKLHPLPKTRH